MHETQGHHVIQVNELTRVEGQGALYIRTEGNRVLETRFKIFEPPRFFEALLRGREYHEVPDITARICGICPVAYQMSSIHALESIFGALPSSDGATARLRRLFYCGEWIESHALHAFFLHLPDYLGKGSVVEIAKENPALVERAIAIRKAGNQLLTALGGRPMHPVGAAVGGWRRAPRRSEMEALRPAVEAGLEATLEAGAWLRDNLRIPEFETGYEFVALRDEARYPMNEGRIASSAGWDIAAADWDSAFEERQVPHSNALHAVLRETGAPYLVGPLSRFNLNYDTLHPRAWALAESFGLKPPVKNPYQSILVRLVETVYCFEEALEIIAAYERPAESMAPLTLRAGEGGWATEAPRGILFHRYRVNEDGSIADAKIVPPTSQNQGMIEADLRTLVEARLGEDDHSLSHACEFMIRNYDPCISCATHFLAFRIDRS